MIYLDMYFRPQKVDKNEFHLVELPLAQTKKGLIISITPVPLLLLSVVGFSIIKNPRFYSYFILFLDCTLTKCKAYVFLSVTLLQLSILSYNIYPKLEKLPSEKLMDTHTHKKDHSAFQPLQIHTEQSCMIKYLTFFLLC